MDPGLEPGRAEQLQLRHGRVGPVGELPEHVLCDSIEVEENAGRERLGRRALAGGVALRVERLGPVVHDLPPQAARVGVGEQEHRRLVRGHERRGKADLLGLLRGRCAVVLGFASALRRLAAQGGAIELADGEGLAERGVRQAHLLGDLSVRLPESHPGGDGATITQAAVALIGVGLGDLVAREPGAVLLPLGRVDRKVVMSTSVSRLVAMMTRAGAG